MKPAVARWLEFAEVDLKAAKALLKEGGLSSVVCFHAQQGVEKCLKALIELMGLNPCKSHDLIMLYGQVEDKMQLDEDTLAKLYTLIRDIPRVSVRFQMVRRTWRMQKVCTSSRAMFL